MSDAELAQAVDVMRASKFQLLVSMAKDSQLDDATIRQAVLFEGKRIQRFIDEHLEDE